MSIIHDALQKAGERKELPPLPGATDSTLSPPKSRAKFVVKTVLGLMVIAVLAGGGWYAWSWVSMESAAELPQEEVVAAPVIEAEPVQEVVADQQPDESRLAAGLEAYKNAQYEESVLVFQELVEQSPEHAESWNNLGLSLWKTGKLEKANEALAHAIELEPQLVQALNNRSMVLSALGQGFEAAMLLRQVLELEPTYADAHFNLAVLMEKEGNWRSAHAAYLKYLELADNADAEVIREVELRIEDLSP